MSVGFWIFSCRFVRECFCRFFYFLPRSKTWFRSVFFLTIRSKQETVTCRKGDPFADRRLMKPNSNRPPQAALVTFPGATASGTTGSSSRTPLNQTRGATSTTALQEDAEDCFASNPMIKVVQALYMLFIGGAVLSNDTFDIACRKIVTLLVCYGSGLGSGIPAMIRYTGTPGVRWPVLWLSIMGLLTTFGVCLPSLIFIRVTKSVSPLHAILVVASRVAFQVVAVISSPTPWAEQLTAVALCIAALFVVNPAETTTPGTIRSFYSSLDADGAPVDGEDRNTTTSSPGENERVWTTRVRPALTSFLQIICCVTGVCCIILSNLNVISGNRWATVPGADIVETPTQTSAVVLFSANVIVTILALVGFRFVTAEFRRLTTRAQRSSELLLAIAEFSANYDIPQAEAVLKRYAATSVADCDPRVVRASRQLLKNLKTFRPHLPNYVLVQVAADDSTTAEGGTAAAAAGSVPSAQPYHVPPERGASNATAASNFPGSIGSRPSTPGLGASKAAISRLRTTLYDGDITFCHVHVIPFRSVDRGVNYYNTVVRAFMSIATQTGASFHTFFGDVFVTSFNATWRMTNPSAAACRYMIKMNSLNSNRLVEEEDDDRNSDFDAAEGEQGEDGTAAQASPPDRGLDMPRAAAATPLPIRPPRRTLGDDEDEDAASEGRSTARLSVYSGTSTRGGRGTAASLQSKWTPGRNFPHVSLICVAASGTARVIFAGATSKHLVLSIGCDWMPVLTVLFKVAQQSLCSMLMDRATRDNCRFDYVTRGIAVLPNVFQSNSDGGGHSPSPGLGGGAGGGQCGGTHLDEYALDDPSQMRSYVNNNLMTATPGGHALPIWVSFAEPRNRVAFELVRKRVVAPIPLRSQDVANEILIGVVPPPLDDGGGAQMSPTSHALATPGGWDASLAQQILSDPNEKISKAAVAFAEGRFEMALEHLDDIMDSPEANDVSVMMFRQRVEAAASAADMAAGNGPTGLGSPRLFPGRQRRRSDSDGSKALSDSVMTTGNPMSPIHGALRGPT